MVATSEAQKMIQQMRVSWQSGSATSPRRHRAPGSACFCWEGWPSSCFMCLSLKNIPQSRNKLQIAVGSLIGFTIYSLIKRYSKVWVDGPGVQASSFGSGFGLRLGVRRSWFECSVSALCSTRCTVLKMNVRISIYKLYRLSPSSSTEEPS